MPQPRPRDTAIGGALLAVAAALTLAVCVSRKAPEPAHESPPAPPAAPQAKSAEQEAQENRERAAELYAKARPAEGRFQAALRKLDPSRRLFADAAISPAYPEKMRILVTTEWDLSPKALRMRAAEKIWRMWAEANAENVDGPDSSRISIVVPGGREIGGSRVWGGSMIWVDD